MILRVVLYGAITILAEALLSASPIARVVAFGDSLADNGNLYALIHYPPSPPYYQGRGSNGPVAVEYLADHLRAPLMDFAVYGATSGAGNLIDGGTPTTSNGLPGVLAEYSNALANGFTVSPDDLYVIMGGPPNDFRLSSFDAASIPAAVANQTALVSMLQAQGAQHILVAGMPDLGVIPFVTKFGPAVAAQVSLLSAAYNSSLQSQLPTGATFVDTSGLMHQILSNPAAYGLTNTTAACTDGVTVCATPDSYFFWDDFHPTTRVHALAGAALANAVPEPATIATLCGGLIVVFAAHRRRSRTKQLLIRSDERAA